MYLVQIAINTRRVILGRERIYGDLYRVSNPLCIYDAQYLEYQRDRVPCGGQTPAAFPWLQV